MPVDDLRGVVASGGAKGRQSNQTLPLNEEDELSRGDIVEPFDLAAGPTDLDIRRARFPQADVQVRGVLGTV